MASAAEPPPKKRKLYEPQTPNPLSPPPPPSPSSPPPPPPQLAPGTSHPPQQQRPPPPSPEEILRKRRNRDELRSLFECYRRIRLCVERKDARLMPELEQAYLALVTASRGCTSVQRILADLIPRYASYCRTALEAAAKVSINMYNWNLAIVKRGEDVDGVAYQTAKACVLGLVDICSTASFEVNSSVIGGICSAVYVIVLTFFVSTFDGKDIYQIGCGKLSKLQDPLELLYNLKQETGDNNQPAYDRLFELRALSLLCIFLSFPKNLLGACFDLLDSAATDVVQKEVFYFLSQVTRHLNTIAANDTLDKRIDGDLLCTDLGGNHSGIKEMIKAKTLLDDPGTVVSESSVGESNDSYMKMAIYRDPCLRGWIFLRYKKLCDSHSTAVLPEVLSCLKEVLGSSSEVVRDIDHMECEDNCEPMRPDNHEKCVGENVMVDQLVSSCEKEVLLGTSSTNSYRLRSKSDMDVEVKDSDDVNADKPCMQLESAKILSVSSSKMKLLDVKTDNCKGGALGDAGYQSMKSDSGTLKSLYASSRGSIILRSPKQHLEMTKHSSTEPSDFYSASALEDVISVSRELWVGSLGNGATGTSIRSKFEEFGPLANFLFCPAKDFALVEYRNIIDAMQARGYMQGSSIWGGSLQIKYLDRLLGSKGSVGGIAVGESCHLYVANVRNQNDKDEVFDELKAAELKRPCGVTDLPSENALLIEFETAFEAAVAKAHIRCQVDSNLKKSLITDVCSQHKHASGHQLFVRNVDNSIPDMDLINAFSRFGEIIGWQFNRLDGSCLIDFRSYTAAVSAKCRLHGSRFGLKSISIELKTCNTGAATDKILSSTVQMLPHGVSDSSSQPEIRYPRVAGYCDEQQRTPRKLNSYEILPAWGELCSSGSETRLMNLHGSSFTAQSESTIREHVLQKSSNDGAATSSFSALQPNWSGRSSVDALNVRPGKSEDVSYTVPADRSTYGPAPSNTDKQIWQYKKIEPNPTGRGILPCPPVATVESNPTGRGILPCPLAATYRGSVMPPPIQASFVRPVYHASGSSWDNTSPNPTFNQIPASMMPGSNFQVNPCAPLPFIPSSVTPLVQLPGCSMQHSEKIPPLLPLPNVVPSPVPAMDIPPPLSSPPPLPVSQPPSVPPPPNSPPPLQPAAEPSDSQTPVCCQWQGTLSKSGVHYCTVYASRVESDACRYTNALLEPAEWPTRLDVTKRTDLKHVKTTFSNFLPNKREVCRLLPCSAGDHKGFRDFISYLRQRECAGVIKIPAVKSMWSRLLFILPHSADTCEMLAISPDPSECLIALILPKETSAEVA